MRRREFISAIAGATVWPFAARAQQPAMPVIGFIAEVPLVEPLLAAFRRAMAELGYVEGKNFAAEYRLKPESLPQAAADLQSCLAAMQATGHPGWAALSAPGMRSLDLPKEVRNVIVFADVGHRLRGTEYINMWPSHSLVLDGGSPADRGHFMLRTRARRRSLPPRLLPSSARISYRQLRIVF